MSKPMIAWSQENIEEIPDLLRDYLDCRHPRTRDALRVALGDRIVSEGGEVDYYSVDGCIKITLQVNLPEQKNEAAAEAKAELNEVLASMLMQEYTQQKAGAGE